MKVTQPTQTIGDEWSSAWSEHLSSWYQRQHGWQQSVSPGGHCWGYYPGTLSYLWVTATHFKYRVLVDETPGRVLPLCWVIWMCRHFDSPFWHSGDWTQSILGTLSHPLTTERSFGVLKPVILTELDLFGPKFHFSLCLFGSNFQRPAAHTPQFSDWVCPPPPGMNRMSTQSSNELQWVDLRIG